MCHSTVSSHFVDISISALSLSRRHWNHSGSTKKGLYSQCWTGYEYVFRPKVPVVGTNRFPAECVVCRVYLRVTTDALQSDIKLRFILRTVWILKTIPGRPGWPGDSDGRRMLSPPRARAAVQALEGLVSRSLCQTCMPSAWQRSCATSAPVSGGFRYGRAELGWFEGQPLIILSKIQLFFYKYLITYGHSSIRSILLYFRWP